MHKLDEEGSLLIPLIMVVLLLLGSIGFGAWAFAGRQDYKDNVDAKIAEAVEASEEIVSLEKEAEFTEREKSPYKTYQGPSALGTLTVTYPKTWSAYIEEGRSGNTELTGYLHPNFVPDTRGETSYALRFEVVGQSYDQVLKAFDSPVKAGRASVGAYRAPKVQQALGAYITGEIASKKEGQMVLFPVRDKTIKIWTEGQTFRGDFATVLEQVTFIP